MTPYELMVRLREKKVLYEYLCDSAVRLDENEDWIILGQSDKGPTKVKELNTEVLRLALPIKLKAFLPPSALEQFLQSIHSSVEGLLEVEYDEDSAFIIYYMHTTLDGLDEGLTTFVKDRKIISQGVVEISRSIKDMMEKMGGGRMPSPGGDNRPEGEPSTSLWSVLEEIDKTPEDDDEGEDPDNDQSGPGAEGFE